MENITLREGLIYAFLGFYVLYALGGIGMTGLLFSLSVGLIVLSFNKKLEITVASVIFSGLLWKIWIERKKEGFQGTGSSTNEIIQKIKDIANKKVFEGFSSSSDTPTGTGSSANEIINKLRGIEQKKVFEPSALFSSSYVEGFENATPESSTNTQPTTTGTAAATNAPTTTPQLEKALPVVSDTAGTTNTTSGFSDKLTDGMFKLGSIPADSIGGSHIDIGTTMMNALNALKPDQVKQMTDDTRKLLETQKSLMGMLSTMKPMLQDGKQLMSTFNDMFGKGGNPMGGMS